MPLAEPTFRAAEAVLSSRTLREACATAGIAETKLAELLTDPDFQKYLSRQSNLRYIAALEKLKRSAEVAVTILAKAVDPASADDTPSPSQVNAAKLILDYAVKSTEFIDILKKLDELENEGNMGEAGCGAEASAEPTRAERAD